MSTRVSGAAYGYWKDHFNAAIKAWPEFSGNIEFPVPGGHRSAGEAYYYFHLWDRRTAYGKARWRLLDFLITYFEAIELETHDGN